MQTKAETNGQKHMQAIAAGAVTYAKQATKYRKLAARKGYQFFNGIAQNAEFFVVLYAVELEWCMKHKCTTLSGRFLKASMRRVHARMAEAQMMEAR